MVLDKGRIEDGGASDYNMQPLDQDDEGQLIQQLAEVTSSDGAPSPDRSGRTRLAAL